MIMTIFTQLLMVLKVIDVVSLTFLGFGEEQGESVDGLCFEKFTPLQMCLGFRALAGVFFGEELGQ